MKASVVALAFVLASTPAAYSQVTQVIVKPLSDDDIKLIRQDIQGAKSDVIKDTMQFNEAEGTVFWPVYKQYAGEQRAIAERRFAIIMDYAKHVDDMSETDARSLTQRMFQVEDDTQALRKKYFPKFESILGARRAAKFYQVDNRLTMITNVQLASQIPLIP